ncbi:zinc finger CCCH domain-containing protein 14 isoform X2 [Spinacia oleracea]|uniref:Zinc finger CCCH domain-containing protein 14 isoform X2 n=1 Tax=Spinacia oleracea TaxID=3562 RepID=A0A9R0J863_SPIOL|nr:zinc finger CCCH domain-containing protein 14 isoform X2 [Spinacia oleracea]
MDNSSNDDYACDIIKNYCLFSSASSSPPSTPSAVAADASLEAGTGLYRARLILENQLYDELLNRYRLAITRLRELSREAIALQEENEWLRLTNGDLTRRLNGVLSVSEQPCVGNVFGASTYSPTSTVIDDDEEEDERITLPKSISIRSPGFFKLVNSPTQINHQSPSPTQHVNGTKLRVKNEEKALEMDVFNQGMYKTELCNKWQETGTCPYSQQCQFAHGVSELRPVIRHPRYKTQVCRMVLSGVPCPYGHRCHFRHSLS